MGSIVQEIHFLSQLSCVRCDELRHGLVTANFEEGNVLTPQTILNFRPLKNLTWIVTEISLRQFNPSPTGSSDFRYEEYDYNGLTNAWITVNGNPIIAANGVNSSALFNRPLLLAFQGGQRVKIIIQRDAASLPASQYMVHVVVNSYFAPANAYGKLSTSLTTIQQP